MRVSQGYTVLVDGYNALHRHPSWGRLPLAEGRARLLALLERAAWPVPHPAVIVVFDSRDPDPLPARHGRLTVRFASPSADAQIQDFIRSAPDPRRVLVVSGDGEILRTAKSHGAAIFPMDRLFIPPGAPRRGRAAGADKPSLSAREARAITDELARRWLTKPPETP
jgi:hypothetical protein